MKTGRAALLTETLRRTSLGAALGLALLGAPAPARADVVIGVAVPRSGAYVAVGEQVLRGI